VTNEESRIKVRLDTKGAKASIREIRKEMKSVGGTVRKGAGAVGLGAAGGALSAGGLAASLGAPTNASIAAAISEALGPYASKVNTALTGEAGIKAAGAAAGRASINPHIVGLQGGISSGQRAVARRVAGRAETTARGQRIIDGDTSLRGVKLGEPSGGGFFLGTALNWVKGMFEDKTKSEPKQLRFGK